MSMVAPTDNDCEENGKEKNLKCEQNCLILRVDGGMRCPLIVITGKCVVIVMVGILFQNISFSDYSLSVELV